MTDKKELTLESLNKEFDDILHYANRTSGHTAVLKMMVWYIIHHGGDQDLKEDCLKVLGAYTKYDRDNESLNQGIREMAEMLSAPEPFAIPSSS